MRPFDLLVGDSPDACESVEEAGEFYLICTEADGPNKQMRESRRRLQCRNLSTGI
jgi:hypothetical protein